MDYDSVEDDPLAEFPFLQTLDGYKDATSLPHCGVRHIFLPLGRRTPERMRVGFIERLMESDDERVEDVVLVQRCVSVRSPVHQLA